MEFNSPGQSISGIAKRRNGEKWMNNPRSVWDARYFVLDASNLSPSYDPWIRPWLNHSQRKPGERVLDLSCGTGRDSRYMAGMGYDTVCLDLSRNALRICRQVAPQAAHIQVDIQRGLPFRDGVFRFILANLSLHYFDRPVTESIVQEVKRCLEKEGMFVLRLNSTEDVNYGAVGYPELAPNLFLVEGEQKRFFDRDSIRDLFATGWTVHCLKKINIDMDTDDINTEPKVVWEVILGKE